MSAFKKQLGVIWTQMIEFMFHSDIEYSEFQSCVMALLWGCWLAFNPAEAGTVANFDSASTLLILRSLFPTWLWSVWFLSLGSVHLMALIYKSWPARRLCSFTAACTWLYVATYLALTSPRMIAVPTTVFFAFGAAWGFLRLRSHIGAISKNDNSSRSRHQETSGD